MSRETTIKDAGESHVQHRISFPSSGTPGEGQGGGFAQQGTPSPHPNPPPEYRGRGDEEASGYPGKSAAPILLFDGVCNLCNMLVSFVLDHEVDHSMRFASLDSETAKRLIADYHLHIEGTGTLVFIEQGRSYLRSTGALRVARHLRRPWRWLTLLIVIPQPVRDVAYDFISRNRYRWFGKLDRCRMPEPAIASRFLS
jgi:predicted DCC family thiol-disulfide oxidoreductase YuxK